MYYMKVECVNVLYVCMLFLFLFCMYGRCVCYVFKKYVVYAHAYVMFVCMYCMRACFCVGILSCTHVMCVIGTYLCVLL